MPSGKVLVGRRHLADNVPVLYLLRLVTGSTISEKIIRALPRLKCPHALEPHQVQGLNFVAIYPVMQWLVKKVLETREEMSDYIRNFSESQFSKTRSTPRDNQLSETAKVGSSCHGGSRTPRLGGAHVQERPFSFHCACCRRRRGTWATSASGTGRAASSVPTKRHPLAASRLPYAERTIALLVRRHACSCTGCPIVLRCSTLCSRLRRPFRLWTGPCSSTASAGADRRLVRKASRGSKFWLLNANECSSYTFPSLPSTADTGKKGKDKGGQDDKAAAEAAEERRRIEGLIEQMSRVENRGFADVNNVVDMDGIGRFVREFDEAKANEPAEEESQQVRVDALPWKEWRANADVALGPVGMA